MKIMKILKKLNKIWYNNLTKQIKGDIMKVIITDGYITEIKQVALNSIRVKDTNIMLTIGTEKFNYRSTSR